MVELQVARLHYYLKQTNEKEIPSYLNKFKKKLFEFQV